MIRLFSFLVDKDSRWHPYREDLKDRSCQARLKGNLDCCNKVISTETSKNLAARNSHFENGTLFR